MTSVRRWARVILAVVIALGVLGTVEPTLAPAEAAGPPPACAYGDRVTRYAAVGDWYRSMVDTTYRVSSSYVPGGLVPVSRSGAPGTGSVRSLVMSDLTAMYRAALAARAPFAVISAYRSYRQQNATFRNWVRRSGLRRALLASARPGHSEHQLGTVVDLTSPASFSGGRATGVGKGPWTYPDWGTTPAGSWLRTNSWKYGFVLSYPKVGSPAKTCYKYEPWHFRYVGREIAAWMQASGFTPREWLYRNGAMDRWQGGGGGTTPSPTPGPAASPSPAATPRPSPSPTPAVSPSPTPAVSPSPSPAESQSTSPSPADPGDPSAAESEPPWVAVLVAIAVVGGVAGIGYVIVDRRRRGGPA